MIFFDKKSFDFNHDLNQWLKLEMWANAQRDGHPAEYIGGALCSTPQSLADAHY